MPTPPLSRRLARTLAHPLSHPPSHPLSHTWRCLVVALLVASGGLVSVGLAAPASAAGCSGTRGVTVVVDFHELGGGVRQGCAPSGGPASEVTPAAGFTLDYVQRQPSFVCRVAGAPSADPCVNTPAADAYWALYWSDGKSGTWSYATAGAGALEVPDGGYVAFAWQGSQTKSPPGLRPAPRTPAPAPEPQGDAPGSGGGTGAGGKGSGGADSGGSSEGSDGAPSATASPQPSPGAGAGKRRPRGSEGSATASATPSADGQASEPGDSTTGPTSDEAGDEPIDSASGPSQDEPGGGVPGWVTLLVLALLVVAGATASVVRRRRGSASP